VRNDESWPFIDGPAPQYTHLLNPSGLQNALLAVGTDPAEILTAGSDPSCRMHVGEIGLPPTVKEMLSTTFRIRPVPLSPTRW
jgi:hypothetical protein